MAKKHGVTPGGAAMCEDLRRRAQRTRIRSILAKDYNERVRLLKESRKTLHFAARIEGRCNCNTWAIG